MDLKNASKWLDVLLNLRRKAVGIKFLLTKTEYLAFEAHENSHRMSYCTMVKRAGDGICQKVHAGHQACPGGSMALGFQEVSQEVISGKRRLGYETYKNLCIAHKVSKNMAYCDHKTYGLAVMPLEAFEKEPDVVIVVCDPYNAMRIVQGYAYHNGHASSIKLSGMQAICQECTSFPYENDQLNISLMCTGTRMLAGWAKDEMAIGMPYHLFPQIVDGIKNTVNPLERNQGKKIIAEKMDLAGLSGELSIHFNHNYDDNAYIGGLVTELTVDED